MTVASHLVPLYHRLPYAGRCLVAGWHGRRLLAWRYGPDSERLAAEALARDRWGGDEWRRFVAHRLRGVLDRAATRVPFYREAWAARRAVSWRWLENWPVLSKEELRRAGQRLLADDLDPAQLYREQSSGTTGTPVVVYHSRQTLLVWYALFEARARGWYGIDRTMPWALLGGQLVAPPRSTRPPYWVWNDAMRQLYLSSYHLSTDTAPAYVAALHQHGVCSLLGYPSMLAALARAIIERRLEPPPLRAVVTNAEPLLAHQRALIEQAFGCPVRETYGLAELTAAASECEAGRLHLWPEVGVVEVEAESADASGPLLATGLLNGDQPLVRYRVGDRIQLAPPDQRCGCGRTLPLVGAIDGRCDDVVRTPDGRVIGRLDPVFKASWPLREAQVRQERIDLVRVLVVPEPRFSTADQRAIEDALRARLGGGVAVVVEAVDHITRGANGKFRAVVSLLDRPDPERSA